MDTSPKRRRWALALVCALALIGPGLIGAQAALSEPAPPDPTASADDASSTVSSGTPDTTPAGSGDGTGAPDTTTLASADTAADTSAEAPEGRVAIAAGIGPGGCPSGAPDCGEPPPDPCRGRLDCNGGGGLPGGGTGATGADLSVTKTDSPDPVLGGSNITYAITVNNAGPDTATGITLTDGVPANTTFVSFTQSAGFNCTPPAPGSGPPFALTCINGTVAANAQANFTMVVNVNPGTAAGTIITNTAVVAGSDDPNPNNNTGTATTTVGPLADLAVTKSGPASVVAGNTFSYTITPQNNGPSAASSVTLSDTLPANTTFQSNPVNTSGFNCSFPAPGTSGTVTCTKATMNAGDTGNIVLVVKVNSSAPNGSTLLNAATITSQAQTDPDATNNSSTAVTVVTTEADVAVSKADTPDPVTPGGTLTYTITVSNAGPSDAAGVFLNDVVPTQTTISSVTTTHGTCAQAATVFTCPLGSVAPGLPATITAVVTVSPAATGTINNSATATTSTPESDPNNNTGTAQTTVTPQADLGVVKTGPPSATAGTNVTYNITVTNRGPNDAQGVQLTDLVPTNTTFVSFMQTSGPTFTLTAPPPSGTGTVTATIPTFSNGASAGFTLTVNVNANTPGGNVINNTATVDSATSDPNEENNSSSVLTAITTEADLSVTKTDNPDPVTAGTNLTYTITVANAGPSDATGDLGVVMNDTVPAGTTFQSLMQTSGPAFNCVTPAPNGTGLVSCSIATLAAGASAMFSMVVNVNSAAPSGSTITNTVTVDTPPLPERIVVGEVSAASTDTDPADNSDTETTTVATSADLGITKSDDPDPVTVGTNLTYTIGVTNAGPSDAVNAHWADTVPAGTTFVSITQNAGPLFTCTTPGPGETGDVTCSISSLAAGASATFTFVVKVEPGAASIFNSAAIGSDAADPNSQNDFASTETTAVGPPVIGKAFGAPSITVGETTTLTFGVDNPNTTTLTGVGFTDTLPDGLLVATPNGLTGSCGGGTITATEGSATISLSGATLGAGESCTFAVNVTATTAGVKDNTTDPVTSENGGTGGTASASIEVVEAPAGTSPGSPGSAGGAESGTAGSSSAAPSSAPRSTAAVAVVARPTFTG